MEPTSRHHPADTPPAPAEVAEVTLLIPAAQLAELELLARRHGLTVGQLLRRHVTSLLATGARTHPGGPSRATDGPSAKP